MLESITNSGAAFLSLMACWLLITNKLSGGSALVLLILSAAIGFSPLAEALQELFGITTSLSLGLLPCVLVALLALILMQLRRRRIHVQGMMLVIAMSGWLIAHSAFLAAEVTWFEPRFIDAQDNGYQWLNDLPIKQQLTICANASLGCQSVDGKISIKPARLRAERQRIVSDPLLILSASATGCYALGVLLVLYGHRRKHKSSPPMNAKGKSDLHSAAQAKIMQIQRSNGYHSFLTPESAEAFGSEKSSAYAGKSLSPSSLSETNPRI